MISFMPVSFRLPLADAIFSRQSAACATSVSEKAADPLPNHGRTTYLRGMKKEHFTIDIVSDTVCPWCFIGKRRLETALAELGEDVRVQIGWRPFQLNPDMPAGGLDRKEYLETKFGGPERARQIYDHIREAGKTVGIEFNFRDIPKTPNTIDSHRLIDWSARRDKQDAVVTALFEAYFLNGRDIGDIDTLVDIAESAGLPADEARAYLESDEDADRIRQEDNMARQMGVSGVPCFIINRKYAVSGAQDPAVFIEAFRTIAAKEAEEAANETA